MIVSYGESMYSLLLQVDVQNVADKKIENRIKIDLESMFNIWWINELFYNGFEPHYMLDNRSLENNFVR